jgi:hypothetical protein
MHCLPTSCLFCRGGVERRTRGLRYDPSLMNSMGELARSRPFGRCNPSPHALKMISTPSLLLLLQLLLLPLVLLLSSPLLCVSAASPPVATVTQADSFAWTNPRGICFDTCGSKIYVPDWGLKQIYTMPIRGTLNTVAPTAIASNVAWNMPTDCEIPPDGSRMYVADYGASIIYSNNFAGTTTRLDTGGLSSPFNIALHPTDGYLYIVDYGLKGLFRMPAAGGAISRVDAVTSVWSQLWDVALDPGGLIAWVTDLGAAHIYKVVIATGAVSQWDSGFNWGQPANIYMDWHSNNLFVADMQLKDIYYMSTVTQTAVSQIPDGNRAWKQPFAVRPDGASWKAWVVDIGGSAGANGMHIYQLILAGNSSLWVSNAPNQLAQNEFSGRIGITATTSPGYCGGLNIALNCNGGTVHWPTTNLPAPPNTYPTNWLLLQATAPVGTTVTCTLTVTGVDMEHFDPISPATFQYTVIAADPGVTTPIRVEHPSFPEYLTPRGLRVDRCGNNMFVADYGSTTATVAPWLGFIWRVPLRDANGNWQIGSAMPVIVPSTFTWVRPYDVEVDPTGNILYVADLAAPHIYKNVWATGVTTQLDVGNSILNPVALTLHPTNGFLYTTDISARHVWKVSTAGSTPVQVDVGFNFASLYGIAADPNGLYVYVTDVTLHHAYKITLAGGAVTQLDVGNFFFNPYFFYADLHAPQLYAADCPNLKIYRINTLTGAVSSVYDGGGIPFGCPFSPWPDSSSSKLWVVDLGPIRVAEMFLANASLTVTGVPATLALGQTSGSITLTPTVDPGYCTGLTMSVQCTGGATVSPAGQQTFAAFSYASKSFTVAAPGVAGQIQCSFTLSGLDADHFNVPANIVIQIVPPAPISVWNVPIGLEPGNNTGPIFVAPTRIPSFSGFTLAISCDGVGGTVFNSPLSFPAGTWTTLWFSYTAPLTDPPATRINCSFVVGGTDMLNFAAPSKIAIPMDRTQRLLSVSTFPSAQINQWSAPVNITPSALPFFTGFSINVDCGAGVTVRTSPLTFPPGSTALQSYTFMPTTVGAVTCTYTLGGADAAHFVVPSPSVFPSVGSIITLTFASAPTSLFIAQYSGSITVSPSGPSASGYTLTMNCGATSVYTGKVLTWPPGSAAPQTFQLRGASFATTSTCVFTPAGDLGVWPPAPFSFPVLTLRKFEGKHRRKTGHASIISQSYVFSSFRLVFACPFLSCSLPHARAMARSSSWFSVRMDQEHVLGRPVRERLLAAQGGMLLLQLMSVLKQPQNV